MSQFKLRYEEMREGNPAKETAPSPATKPDPNRFETPGHSRVLRFTWPDGKRMFFNYSYMVKAECSKDETTLTLYFSGESVVLKGKLLAELYEEISQQQIREILATEERYLEIEDHNGAIVTDISVMPN